MNGWIRHTVRYLSYQEMFSLVCRLNRDVLKEVEQEFLVTKTIQEMEMNRDLDVNFVGLFIEADDKVSSLRTINFSAISDLSHCSCFLVCSFPPSSTKVR